MNSSKETPIADNKGIVKDNNKSISKECRQTLLSLASWVFDSRGLGKDDKPWQLRVMEDR